MSEPLPPLPSPPQPPPRQTAPTIPSNLGRTYSAKLFTQRNRALKSSHLVLLTPQQLQTAIPSAYNIPVSFDPYDQGPIGSCTANALCTSFKLQTPAGPQFDPSRLFLYYVERSMSNLIGQEGAYLDDGYNTLKNTGICKESTWPYNISVRDTRPPNAAYTVTLQRGGRSRM